MAAGFEETRPLLQSLRQKQTFWILPVLQWDETAAGLFVTVVLELVYISSDADLSISPNSNLALMVNNWSHLVLIGSRVLTFPQKLTCRGN